MITKKDLMAKCQFFPDLKPLVEIIGPRDFTEAELESIDFVIEAHHTLKIALETIKSTMIAKLEIWLASTKGTD